MTLRTPAGVSYSQWRPISRVLPRGGVLSPFLWPPHSNQVRGRFKVLWETRSNGFEGLRRTGLPYADNVAVALPQQGPRAQVEASNSDASSSEKVLEDRDLATQEEKATSTILSPFYYAGGLLRRREKEEEETTTDTFRWDSNPAHLREKTSLAPDNGGGGWSTGALEQISPCLPYHTTHHITISGVTFDRNLSFTRQLRSVFDGTSTPFVTRDSLRREGASEP